jgi:uncharacterized protein involved in oxidation of intracellular sulfur
VNIFLLGDAVTYAVLEHKTPDRYNDLEKVLCDLAVKNVAIKHCGPCLDARGLNEQSLIDRVERGSLGDLSRWTSEAEKVLTF